MSDRDRDERGRPRYSGPRDRLGRPSPRGSRDEMAGAPEPAEVAPRFRDAVETGAGHFDRERFFEAHEFFEYAWKSGEIAEGDRDFWKGITQVAVGFCHAQRGNVAGAATTLRRAAGYLDRYPREHEGVAAAKLAAAARRLAVEIEARGAGAVRFPRFPWAAGREPS